MCAEPGCRLHSTAHPGHRGRSRGLTTGGGRRPVVDRGEIVVDEDAGCPLAVMTVAPRVHPRAARTSRQNRPGRAHPWLRSSHDATVLSPAPTGWRRVTGPCRWTLVALCARTHDKRSTLGTVAPPLPCGRTEHPVGRPAEAGASTAPLTEAPSGRRHPGVGGGGCPMVPVPTGHRPRSARPAVSAPTFHVSHAAPRPISRGTGRPPAAPLVHRAARRVRCGAAWRCDGGLPSSRAPAWPAVTGTAGRR